MYMIAIYFNFALKLCFSVFIYLVVAVLNCLIDYELKEQ